MLAPTACWLTVGTTNINRIGMVMASAANLIIHDRRFVQQLTRMLEHDMEQSRVISMADVHTKPMAQKWTIPRVPCSTLSIYVWRCVW